MKLSYNDYKQLTREQQSEYNYKFKDKRIKINEFFGFFGMISLFLANIIMFLYHPNISNYDISNFETSIKIISYIITIYLLQKIWNVASYIITRYEFKVWKRNNNLIK